MLGPGKVRAAWIADDAGPVDVAAAKAQLLRFALATPTTDPVDTGPWIPRGDADQAANAIDTTIRVMPKHWPSGTARYERDAPAGGP